MTCRRWVQEQINSLIWSFCAPSNFFDSMINVNNIKIWSAVKKINQFVVIIEFVMNFTIMYLRLSIAINKDNCLIMEHVEYFGCALQLLRNFQLVTARLSCLAWCLFNMHFIQRFYNCTWNEQDTNANFILCMQIVPYGWYFYSYNCLDKFGFSFKHQKYKFFYFWPDNLLKYQITCYNCSQLLYSLLVGVNDQIVSSFIKYIKYFN